MKNLADCVDNSRGLLQRLEGFNLISALNCTRPDGTVKHICHCCECARMEDLTSTGWVPGSGVTSELQRRSLSPPYLHGVDMLAALREMPCAYYPPGPYMCWCFTLEIGRRSPVAFLPRRKTLELFQGKRQNGKPASTLTVNTTRQREIFTIIMGFELI